MTKGEQSMIDNKGYWWASGYWSANAGQQATNSVVTRHPESRKYFYGWVCRTVAP